jgi:tetratricopeptide (TPR) repeat protein
MSDFDIEEMLHEADKFADEEKYIEAAEIYSKITNSDTNYAAAWYGLGISKAKLGNLDEAIRAFEQAHRINPDYGATNANLAFLLEKIDPERAANFARMAMESIGEKVELLRISNLMENIEISLFDYSHKYVEEKQEEIIILPSKTISETIQEKGKEVEELDFVNSKTARSSRANKMTEKGDHAAAVNEWKELLKKDSSDISSWKGLADALSKAGYIERANQCLQRVEELTEIEKESREIDENEEMENLISAAKEVKERIELVEENNSRDVNESIEWYNKGLVLLSENNPSESLNCFDKALQGSPEEEIELRVRAHNGKGHALYQLDKFADSIQEYHSAIVLDPASVTGRTLYNMGSSYASIELYADAVKCFEQAKNRGMGKEDQRLCQTQISRCKLLIKEQKKLS